MTINPRGTLSGRSLLIGGLLLMCVAMAAGVAAQAKREIGITARKYRFQITNTERAEIRVTQDDLLLITLKADDIPHSFTLPEYRIQKRVEPGRDVTFEFRAEKPGRFEFYCSLTNDRCREQGMIGVLIVDPKS